MNGEAPSRQMPSGAGIKLTLASGGSISLLADVNVFALSVEDRQFLYALVDLIRDYGATHEPQAAPAEVTGDE